MTNREVFDGNSVLGLEFVGLTSKEINMLVGTIVEIADAWLVLYGHKPKKAMRIHNLVANQ